MAAVGGIPSFVFELILGSTATDAVLYGPVVEDATFCVAMVDVGANVLSAGGCMVELGAGAVVANGLLLPIIGDPDRVAFSGCRNGLREGVVGVIGEIMFIDACGCA